MPNGQEVKLNSYKYFGNVLSHILLYSIPSPILFTRKIPRARVNVQASFTVQKERRFKEKMDSTSTSLKIIQMRVKSLTKRNKTKNMKQKETGLQRLKERRKESLNLYSDIYGK